MNYAEIMPFYSLTDFNVENEFISTKRKLENLMNNEKFENFLKDNKYEQILNPSNVTPCEYFDEEEFSKKNIGKVTNVWIFFHSISEAYLNIVVNGFVFEGLKHKIPYHSIDWNRF